MITYKITKKIRLLCHWLYVIDYLTGEEIVGMFYEKELLKTNQT